MEKKDNNITNKAALWALVFAGGSIVYSYLSGILSEMSALSGTKAGIAIALALWLLKFCGLNYLMYYVMKKTVMEEPQTSLRDVRRLGNFIAFFSAILVAIWTYVDFSFISTDRIQGAYEVMMTQQGMDSNTLEALAYVMGNLPLLGTIWQLFYCCLYGLCLSSICSLILMKKLYFDKTNL